MDDKTLKLIGTKIRLKRTEMGYSQMYMSKKLKISQNVYSRNERNIKNAPFIRVMQILEILEISISIEI